MTTIILFFLLGQVLTDSIDAVILFIKVLLIGFKKMLFLLY